MKGRAGSRAGREKDERMSREQSRKRERLKEEQGAEGGTEKDEMKSREQSRNRER